MSPGAFVAVTEVGAAALPSQVLISTLVPLMPTVPLLAMVQVCAAALPSQFHISTLVPGVLEPPATSTHSAVSSPATIGPAGVAEPTRVTDRLPNWSVW